MVMTHTHNLFIDIFVERISEKKTKPLKKNDQLLVSFGVVCVCVYRPAKEKNNDDDDDKDGKKHKDFGYTQNSSKETDEMSSSSSSSS